MSTLVEPISKEAVDYIIASSSLKEDGICITPQDAGNVVTIDTVVNKENVVLATAYRALPSSGAEYNIAYHSVKGQEAARAMKALRDALASYQNIA